MSRGYVNCACEECSCPLVVVDDGVCPGCAAGCHGDGCLQVGCAHCGGPSSPTAPAPYPCDACGDYACEPDEVCCPRCKGRAS